MKKTVYTSLFILFITQYCYAQNTDSLLGLLKADAADTNKVKHLNSLSQNYFLISEFEQGLIYGKQALQLSQSLGFKKGLGNAYNTIGAIYSTQGNYPRALENYFASLKVHEEIKDKDRIANCYNNIGLVYQFQGNISVALKNHQLAIKIRKEIKDMSGLASSYNNIGIIYYYEGNYPEALQNCIASLKIEQQENNKKGVATSYDNLANIYEAQGNYAESLKNHLVSLKIRQEIDDKEGVASSYINMGTLYVKLNNANAADSCLEKALILSKLIDSKDAIRDCYAGLFILDSIKGDFKTAFEHHKMFIAYRDSIDNEDTQNKSMQVAMQYEFDKKEIAAKAEQEKINAINDEEKQKQKIIIFSVAGILLIVVVFSLFLYKRFRITQKQKQLIEEQKVLVDVAYEQLHEKNKEVMDSIHYAHRIQRALITSEKYIEKQLNRLMNKN